MLDINYEVLNILGYSLSLIELAAVVTGLLSVLLAVRNNIFTWPVGIINVVCFGILLWQVQLYADVLLQLYFLVTSIYGWIYWARQKLATVTIQKMQWPGRLITIGWVLVMSAALGYLTSRVHIWIPSVFENPASYPFADSFITVASITATILLARHYIENWVLWILNDIVCIGVYFAKDIRFIGLEYIVLLGMAISGLVNWVIIYKRETGTGIR